MKPAPKPRNEADRLEALYEYEILDTDPEEIFDDLTKLASYILGVPITLISLVDKDRQWFKSRYGLEASETPRDLSFCAYVVADGKPLIVPNAIEDDRFSDNPLVLGAPHIRFYAGAPLTTPNGEVLGTLCAIDRKPIEPDPEKIKMLEALARQAMGELELRRQLIEKSRLNSITEASPDFIGIIDEHGRPVYLNQSARNILGISPGGRLPDHFSSFVPPWVSRFIQEKGLVIAQSESEWFGESEIVDANGNVIPVLQLLFPLKDRYSTGPHFAWRSRDITDEKKLAQIRNEFVSTVSHELRTPITSILGSLRLIESGTAGEIPPKTAQLIKIASSNSERLIRLINDILDLQKLEGGKLDFNVSLLDPVELLQRAVTEVYGMAQTAGVEVIPDVSSLPFIRGDADRLVQVLVNLLSNAIKFSPRGAKVTASGETSNGRVKITVSDQGPGIAQKDLSKLFGKFQQIDSSDSRAKGGTGLGLAISKEIVERLGGSIGVQSQTGKGSTFWFELPIPDAASSGSVPNGK